MRVGEQVLLLISSSTLESWSCTSPGQCARVGPGYMDAEELALMVWAQQSWPTSSMAGLRATVGYLRGVPKDPVFIV